MATIFGKRKICLKNGQSILHIYPVGQKFRRNRSISHGLGDTSNFKFYHFCPKFENSKWLPFLERGNFFFEKMCRVSCLDTLWAKNFAEMIICELFVMNTTSLHECIVFPQIRVQTFKFRAGTGAEKWHRVLAL